MTDSFPAGLLTLAVPPAFPSRNRDSGFRGGTCRGVNRGRRIQWRGRAGFSPASLDVPYVLRKRNQTCQSHFTKPARGVNFVYSKEVQVNVQLPDDLSRHADPAREALEAFAIESYRSGALARPQAARLLGLSRFEFNDFLASRNVYEHAYSIDDLRNDLADLTELRKQFPVAP